jgi:hypothetical protein
MAMSLAIPVISLLVIRTELAEVDRIVESRTIIETTQLIPEGTCTLRGPEEN